MAERDLTVPKFSSFKSKDPPKEEPKKHLKKDSKDSKRRHESRSRHEPRRPPGSSEVKPRPGAGPSGAPGVFVIDTNGDPLIARYGGIDKSQIPAYHRDGGGRVLGTAGRLIVHRDQARDQFSLRMPGEGSAERDGLRAKKPAIARHPVALRARGGGAAKEGGEGADDYLPLSSSKRKRGRSDDSTDEDEPSYRSIERRATKRRDFGSESEDASADDVVVTSQNDPLKWKSIQLSQRVRDRPGDVDAWLELVDHQDALLKAGEEMDQGVLEDEARSYAEIKVSMLEKALANASSKDRRRVLVRLMREGAKVWSSKATAKRWASILEDEDDDFPLWKAHFDFLVSDMASFRFQDAKKILTDRLRRSLSRGGALGEAIHVFLMATRFIHDAGYKELAVAAWQGLLEFNLFRPPSIRDEQSALEAFQDFWESEVPRIGDVDAKGWRHYATSGAAGDPPDPVVDEPVEPSDSRDTYVAWGFLEQLRAQKAKMPARTMDDGMQDDLFRVVMFVDIAPFLLLIPDVLLPGLAEQLVDAFLLFCGFQPAFGSSPWIETARDDQFLSPPLNEVDLGAADDFVAESGRQGPHFTCGNAHAAALSPSTLFGGARWFQYVVCHDSGLVDMSWMSEMLRQIVHATGVESLAPYYLAVRFATAPTTIKKTAKALLKQYPAKYEVYNGYALCEFANKEPEIAHKVFASITGTASLSAQWHRFLLYKSWSWMELELGNKKMATSRLCASVEKAHSDAAEVGRAMILKARQDFTSEFDRLLVTDDLEGASTLAECLVLLSYLTAEGNTEPASMAQGNITSAMSVVEAISRDFALRRLASSTAHERVLQFAAQLLHFNASNGPFRRAYMREELRQFIDFFPRNTIFLSLFEWADASLRVVDETRDVVGDKALVKAHDCVSSRVFSIRHELTHGNVNTVKAAFEQALSSDVCQNSAMLWTWYIRFCQSEKSLRERAKDVFYRALRRCPGSKGIVMEAFGTLVRDMEREELRAVYDTMAWKGLRIHVDLEEFLVLERQASK